MYGFVLGLCGTTVPHHQPHVRTLDVCLSRFGWEFIAYFKYFHIFLDLSWNLSQSDKGKEHPTLPSSLQISCLLLWLQRDANIRVQALRSIQHTLYSSVFHSRCPSGTHSFSLHYLLSVSSHSPYRFCLAVSQKLSNVSLRAVVQQLFLSSLFLTFLCYSSSSISCQTTICDPASLCLSNHFELDHQHSRFTHILMSRSLLSY